MNQYQFEILIYNDCLYRNMYRWDLCFSSDVDKKNSLTDLYGFDIQKMFLSDPGVPGVQSMGPVVTKSERFVKLN